MPRSPFSPARVATAGALVAPNWAPGARTLRRAQERERAARMAPSRPKVQRVPLTVRGVSVACKAIGRAALWVMTNYPKARSFLLAHSGGIVSPGETTEREACCKACPYGYERDGESYCRGANGGRGCGCGHRPMSRRNYKLRLAAYRCPQGRFGMGGLARWLFGK